MNVSQEVLLVGHGLVQAIINCVPKFNINVTITSGYAC